MNLPRLSHGITAAALLLISSLTVTGQEPTSENRLLNWLQGLVAEARADLGLLQADTTRLFNETLPDGRSWMEYITAEFGKSASTDWAQIDQAVGILLKEADYLKTLGAQSSDAARQAIYRDHRKKYLEATAALLAHYKAASAQVFDDTIGGLVAPAGVPDWILPGAIEIKQVSGAARLNLLTREFGGRLSGEVALPKFDATFAVPNASFDSRGNLDLTAYGTASFPPGEAGKVTLSIPARRPLRFHLSESGDFRVAGSGRLELPDGNEFEAHFDADHPMYEFGLAYSGDLTIEMAKELTLLRPTIDLATVFDLQVIDGLGQFFGSLGQGYEAFLEDAPDLPSLDDLNVGVAPEFTDPESAIPLDVLDAWMVGIVNDEVRPLLNGAASGPLQTASTLLRSIKGEIKAAQQAIALDRNQLDRLRRHSELVKELGEVAKRSRDESLLGNQEDSDLLFEESRQLAIELESAARDYLLALPPDASLGEIGGAMNLWGNSDATATLLSDGTYDSLPLEVREASVNKLEAALAIEFANYGLDLQGTVIDPDQFAGTTLVDLEYLTALAGGVDQTRVLFTRYINDEPDLTNGESWLDRDGPLKALPRLAFERARTGYLRALEENDLGEQYLNAGRLFELGQTNTLVQFTSNPGDTSFMLESLNTTIQSVGGYEARPEQQKLSARLLEAAINHRELQREQATRRARAVFVAGTDEDPRGPLAERYQFGSPSKRTFLARHYFALRTAIDAGLLDAALEGELKLNLAAFMRFWSQAQLERYANGDLIEANLDDAYTALLAMLDMVAITEDMLPEDGALIGELQANWQALHLTWIGVAQAQRAHWYLSAYASEIADATERYGDGMNQALKDAAKTAGSEAIRGLYQVIDYLGEIVDGIGLEEFELALPGDMQIQNAFGVLGFDVSEAPPTWDFRFGGQVYFADYDLTFAVPSASLASTGDFDLNLLTEGPVPFGFEEDFRLSTEFGLTGNVLAPRIDAASANADLTYFPDLGPPEIFTGTINYSFLEESMGHRFGFDATFAAPRQLFTKEVAAFNGGFGFALELDPNGLPQQGNVQVGISMGFLAREDADLTTLQPEDYWLNLENAQAEVNFSVTERTADIRITSGTLLLPDLFSRDGASERARITLLDPLCVRVDFENESIFFCEEGGGPFRLGIEDVFARIPGLDGAEVEFTDVVLRLSGAEFPVLETIDATLRLPLPAPNDPDRLVAVGINGKDWSIDGLPAEATITLESTVRLFDLAGFTFDLLGGENTVQTDSHGATGPCQTTLTFTSDDQGNVAFEFFGGIRAAFESGLVYSETGDVPPTYETLSATICGQVRWDLQGPPEFSIDVAELAGRFRLGGADGIGVQGVTPGSLASIRFEGLENLFDPSEAEPFRITLNGALDLAGYATFALRNTTFIYTGDELQFRPGEFIFEAGEESIDLIDGILPAYITEARLEYISDENLTLEELLNPTNFKITVSGEIHLPNKQAIDEGSPGISGQVDDFSMTIVEQSPGIYVPLIDVPNGFGMQIQNLDIPPLGDLTGGLYIGNLNHPQQLYFAGIVGGKINGIGAEILLAINTTGVIGACFDLNAGPNGLTLAYGFQITGATGGISFGNKFADPCDFSSYIRMQTDPSDGVMKPVNDGSEDPFTPTIDPDAPPPEEPPVVPWDHCLVTNAGGTFPLDSVNPLCEPHPTVPNRVVYRGSIVGATQQEAIDNLESIGITPAAFQLNGTLDQAIDFAAAMFRAEVAKVDDLFLTNIKDIDATNPVYEYMDSVIKLALDGAENMARASLRDLMLGPVDCNTDGFIGTVDVAGGGSPSYYDIILELAQCGIPCQDITLKVKGKISHLAVSSFLYGEVGVTLSTTGTVGVEGAIVLIGIPVGEGQFVYQLTDTTGAVNPSYGGIANIGIGPIDFGRMSFGYRCDDCIPGMLTAFENMLLLGFQSASPELVDLFLRLMDQAVPLAQARTPSLTPAQHFAQLATVEQRVAVLVEVFNLVNLQNAHDELANVESQVDLAALYGDGIDGLIVELMGHFKGVLAQMLETIDLVMCMESSTQPKIFGFPLGSDVGSSLSFNSKAVYGNKTYHELQGSSTISPSQMLSSVLTNGFGAYLPAQDTASFGFSLRVDAFDAESAGDAINDPLGFAAKQMSNFINEAVVTFDYRLEPFGMKLASGQARGIMPRFDEHPERAGVNWSRPEGPEVASRSEVILAALNKDLLSDETWRGGTGQLYQLFEGSDPDGCALGIEEIRNRIVRVAMNNLDLAVNFFPYGGLIGGAELELPNFLTELPPPTFTDLLTPPTAKNAAEWLANASDIFNNYLTASTCVGQMAMYIPAPTPPGMAALDNPGEMWEAMLAADFQQIVNRNLPSYPISELMLEGWLEVPILGMPVMRGNMQWREDEKVFHANLDVPQDGWLNELLGANATVQVTIEAPPYLRNGNSTVSVQDLIDPVKNAVDVAINSNGTVSNQLYDDFVAVVRDSLPKAEFSAAADFTVPPELQPYVQGGSNLEFYGFSFAHSPDHEPGSADPYDLAKQRGGLGLRGDFQFGYQPAGISFQVDQVGMSVTPGAGTPFPALNATVQVSNLDTGVLPPFRDGELTFSSSPNNRDPRLKVSGTLETDSLVFTIPGTNPAVDLLSLSAPGGGDLGGTLEILRADGAPNDTATSILINPARATMPFLGQDVAITVYGADDPNDPTQPFSFSAVTGQEWRASFRITNAAGTGAPTLRLRDPRTPAGAVLVAFTPRQPLTGILRGSGLSTFSLEFDVPLGAEAVFFERQPTETTVALGSQGNATFFIDHLGRFFLDFGEDLALDLPGIVNASGRVVFGYNSTGANPVLDPVAPASHDFGPVDLAESRTQLFTIRNSGLATAVVNVTVDQATHYTVTNGTFTLDPGAPGFEHQVAVVFHPQELGAHPATLTVSSNDPFTPVQTIALDGEGTGTPRYFQSRNDIVFGPTVVGGTSTGTITIGNAGSAPLNITGMNKSGDPEFTVAPALGPQVVPPGASTTYTVSFSPLDKVPFSGSLRVMVEGERFPFDIPLTGTGAESQWFTIRDSEIAGSSSHLNDIHMDSALRGHAVGENGVVLQTTNGGHSWVQRDFTSYNLHAIAPARTGIGGTLIAEYHFEDPASTLVFRDDSGNSHHAASTLLSKPRPVDGGSAVPGATNSWLSFGTSVFSPNNYLDLGDFPYDSGILNISFWLKPDNFTGNQAYLGKNSSGGANEFIFGYYSGNPTLFVGANPAWTVPVQLTTAWQHIFITLNTSGGSTTATFYHDGAPVGPHTFPVPLHIPAGGRPWSLGSEWDTDGRNITRGDYARAGIDEVYFIEGAASRTALAAGGPRMAIVGDGGMAFHSFSNGNQWGQVPDPAAYGWQGVSEGYDPFQWFGAGFDANGKMFLAGRNGNASAIVADDGSGNFSEIGTPLAGAHFTGAFTAGSALYAHSSAGFVYRATDSDGTWIRQGRDSIPGGAFAGHGSRFGYVTGGAGGGVLYSLDGNAPSFLASGSGHTIRAIDYRPSNPRLLHAVGDDGLYLTSPNQGANWDSPDDGLTGNNRGVAVIDTEVWAAGEEQRISFRPAGGPAQSFLVFDPGELDFGYLLAGESKTLPLRIYNRGRRDLVVNSVSISGSAYSIFQADIDRLSPGDWVSILVRYEPGGVASEQDLGTLTLSTPARDFQVPLTGRRDSGRWRPKLVKNNQGNPIDGEIIDMVFTSAQRGYVVYRSDSGLTGVTYTTDGGETWNSSLILPFDFTQRYEINAIDMVGPGDTTDQGYVVGSVVEAATGNFVRGFVHKSTDGGRFFLGANLPAPNDRACRDVAIHDSANPGIAVVSTSPLGLNGGNVWQTVDAGSSWIARSGAAPKFDPDRVAVAPNVNNPAISHVFTNQGTGLYFRALGTSWPAPTPAINFPDAQSIRDFAFYDDPAGGPLAFDNGWIVGDSGLFWRLEPGQLLDWRPAEDAEVFATTDLTGVAFFENSRGWICGESRIFRSNNGGRSWSLSFDAGPAGVMNAIAAPVLDNALTGGSLDGQAALWVYSNTTAANVPVLAVEDLVLLPDLDPGESQSSTITLQNIGTPGTSLELYDAVIESSDPLSRFEIVNTSANAIEVRFTATPEPEFAADLDPEVFLRFEQARDASEYFDDSIYKRHATPAAGNAAPQITREALARDRCLHFDGNDHAEIDATFNDLADDFTISLWANPEQVASSQFFLGKHTPTGNTNLVLFGMHDGGYYFGIRSDFHTEGALEPGWQHLVVTGRRSGNSTDVTVWRHGKILWQHTLTQVIGDLAGQPWILGADRDGGGVIDQHLRGCLDDVAIFNRALSPGEIAKLGTRSPLVGEHRARLVINSNAGENRTVDLRATVTEPGEMIVFNSEPPGQEILIDGDPYTTPVAFAVKSTATSKREWSEGSLHTVTLTNPSVTVTNGDGDDVLYEFENWDGSKSTTQTLCASRQSEDQTASYAIATVQAGVLAPAPGTGTANPIDIIEALIDTPAGPFLRITDGHITLPAAADFMIGGSLFVSPSRLDGTVSTTPISFPLNSAIPYLEIGASDWNFHLEGGLYRLSANPPAVTLMGIEAAPAAGLEFLLAEDRYDLDVTLSNDYKPIPGYLEFKNGSTFSVGYNGVSHSLSVNGGVRAIETPDGWLAEPDVNITLATPGDPVIVNLRTALGLPDPLLQQGQIEIGWFDDPPSAGNATFTYGPGGLGLAFNGMTLDAFGGPLLNNAGISVTTGGLLELSEDVGTITLSSDLTLTPPADSDGKVLFRLQAGAEPSIQIKTPSMELQSSALSGGTITIPPLSFNTAGDFDTGRLALPPLTLGGIAITPRPDGGALARNHVRLSRLDGLLQFDLRAEILQCGWFHQLDLHVAADGAVSGSMLGKFCTPLPEFPLSYDNSDPNFQFRAVAPGGYYEVGFGSAGFLFNPNPEP